MQERDGSDVHGTSWESFAIDGETMKQLRVYASANKLDIDKALQGIIRQQCGIAHVTLLEGNGKPERKEYDRTYIFKLCGIKKVRRQLKKTRKEAEKLIKKKKKLAHLV